jgi:hypothetical protein
MNQKRINKMKLMPILIVLVSIVSCKKTDNIEITNSQIKSEKVITTTLKNDSHIFDEDFLKFSKKFQEKSLPLKIEYKSNNWFDFSSEIELKEIDKSSAVKYLLNNDKTKIFQSDGGIKQFYYAYKIIFPNKNIGLIYYRTDHDYIGFVMTIYDSKGKYIKDEFLAGSNGEYDIEAQKDVLIDSNGEIKISEIKILIDNTDLNFGILEIIKYDSSFNMLERRDNQKVKINIDQSSGRINVDNT